MRSSKTALYQAEQIRIVESMAKEELRLSEDELMARAGLSAFSTLKRLYPRLRSVAVFCGSGNNAGDGARWPPGRPSRTAAQRVRSAPPAPL